MANQYYLAPQYNGPVGQPMHIEQNIAQMPLSQTLPRQPQAQAPPRQPQAQRPFQDEEEDVDDIYNAGMRKISRKRYIKHKKSRKSKRRKSKRRNSKRTNKK